MVESSHFQNWLRAIIREDIFGQVWIIPSDYPRNKMTLKSLGIVESLECRLKVFQFPVDKKTNQMLFRGLDFLFGKEWRSIFLFKYLKNAKPDFLHFHELQHGAYLFNPISKYFLNQKKFRVISSTWGSDLLFYGKLESHKTEIGKVLSWSDVVTAERVDDKIVCEQFDFKNQFIAPVYITVGMKTPIMVPDLKTSNRKLILIKGYQDNHGRALNALSALELVESDLRNYQIGVFSASESVRLQVEFLSSSRNWNIHTISRTTNQQMKTYFSQARLYVGLAISDGLSTSMVEAMAGGAFPIQSINSAARVFIKDGVSGFIVNPWEVNTIAQRIDQALNNDRLVDDAMTLNIRTLENKYNYEYGIAQIRSLYEEA
jgi:glycosyltransferase involved in cell wall biosynthesis